MQPSLMRLSTKLLSSPIAVRPARNSGSLSLHSIDSSLPSRCTVALPQKQESSQPLEETTSGRVSRAVGGGWQFNGWWIFLLVALAFGIFIWFAGWGWGGYGGWLWGVHNRAATVNGQPVSGGAQATAVANGVAGEPANSQASLGQTVTNGDTVLAVSDRRPFIGKSLRLQNVEVEAKDGGGALWVGGNKADPLLVVVGEPAANQLDTNIARGQRINIVGTMEKAPSEATAKRAWNLGQRGATRLSQEGAYVQATHIAAAQS